jgi:hypothetical protein
VDKIEVIKDGETLVVRSSDSEIKQVFFSWASCGTGLRIKEHPEYYGRDVDPRSPPPGTVLHGDDAQRWATENADDHLWEWRLTRESAEELIVMIKESLAEPLRFRMTSDEYRAAKHVVEVLRKTLEE